MFPPNQKYINQRTPPTSQSTSLNRYSVNSPHEISDGWSNALLLAELSRLCTSCSTSEVRKYEKKNSLQSLSTPKENVAPPISIEEESLVYLLNHCRFPVDQWNISLKLLGRWRQLYTERTFSGVIGTNTTTTTTTTTSNNNVFPRGISLASKAHLMRNLSYSNNFWVDVLSLYEISTRDKTNHDNVDESQIESEKDHKRKISNRSELRWMRHIALTSLLQVGKWKESLYFYRHMLYQRETPSHICTGHLIQRLGEVGCWKPVISIFELHLKLLEATRSRDLFLSENLEDSNSSQTVSTSSPSLLSSSTTSTRTKTTSQTSQKRANEWGTMFSMALDVVSRVCQQPRLAVKMFDEAHKKNKDGSLFRWDGNFLSAVQALPSEQERITILHHARVTDQLDIFKLIRGLIHHKKWMEAIALFAEGITNKKITRKEVGRCRLGILHATNTDNVQIVLRILQNLCGRPTSSLRVNDAEVECMISKVPAMESLKLKGNGKPISKAHWQFCLRVLSENYTCFSGKGNTQRSSLRDERHPTIHMLSLLLRNSSIPWYKALSLLTLSQILNNKYSISGNDEDLNSSISSKALMFNHVIEILHAQGEYQRMKDLLLRILRKSELSPSSGMLEFVPLEFLLLNEREPERNKLKVEDTVLYHFIQNTLNWSRALSILLLVEGQRAGVESSSSNTSNSSKLDPLYTLPASVHCGTLKMLRRCAPHNTLWILSLHYFQHVVSHTQLSIESLQKPNITSHPQQSKTEVESIVYRIMYETLLNLLSESPIVSGTVREHMCFQLVERVLEYCKGRIPTHMLLPNQMDRLLPRFFSQTDDDLLNVEQRTRVGIKLARCVIILLGTPAYVDKLNTFHHYSSDSSDAVMFHELQKLVCRVAEYRSHTDEIKNQQSNLSESPSHQTTTRRTTRVVLEEEKMRANNTTITITSSSSSSSSVKSNLIWQTSLELLELQCNVCGVHTVSPGTLKLVYQSCAMTGGQWKSALIATEHLFNYQKKSLSSTSLGIVRSDHCSLYCSLFGWEKALEFWGTNFPQCMLREVSGNYRAIDYCMRLTE